MKRPWRSLSVDSFDVAAMARPAESVATFVFFDPGPAFFRIWHFAGPVCCVKASRLARGAGVPASWCSPPVGMQLSSCFSTQAPLVFRADASVPQRWEEWWPRLAEESLADLLGRHGPLVLDRAWATLRKWPGLANRPTVDGRPFLVAVQHGQRGLAELLLRSGAHLGKRAGDLLLHEAASRGDAAVVALLLSNADSSIRADPWATVNSEPKRQGGTALDAALARGRMECAELIMSAGGRHSLHWAAKLAIVADVEAWLKDGAHADDRDGSGATPLWLLVKGTSSKCAASTVTEARDRCMGLLLEARATVDVLPISMETPLLLAAAAGDASCCAQLLAARADPHARDRKGRTPLDCSANVQIRGLLDDATCAGAWDTSPSACGHHSSDWGRHPPTSSRILPADCMTMREPQPSWRSGSCAWH